MGAAALQRIWPNCPGQRLASTPNCVSTSGEAAFAGETIDGLAVDAAIEAGSILLRRFEGTARGARLAASGMLGDGGRLSDGRLSIETEDATPLADLLPVGLASRHRHCGTGPPNWMCRSPDRRRRWLRMYGWHWPMGGWRRARRST